MEEKISWGRGSLGPRAHATLVSMKSWEGSQWDGSSCKRLIKKNCFYFRITCCYWNWRQISKMHFFLGDRWKNHNSKTIGRPSGLFFFKYLIENFAKFPSNDKKNWIYPREKRISKSYPILWWKCNKICQKKIKLIWRLVVRTQ